MRSKKLFKTVASFALIGALVAPVVLKPATPAKAVTNFSLSKSSVSLATGSSKTIKIKGYKKKTVATWKSANSKIASVSGKGKKGTIKAVGAGNTTITCNIKFGMIKRDLKVAVKVRQAVTSLSISGDKSIDVGKTVELKALINGGKTGSTTNQTVKWKSSNTSVASVSKKNISTAKVKAKKAGSAVITLTAGGRSATITVTVKATGGGSSKTGSDSKSNAKATPTPWTYAKGVVYKQHYPVTRWYNPGTNQGHKYDGYKNNTFAIWMVGFFDNPYSTNEDDLNTFGGPELDDYKGKPLNISGQFQYEGTKQNTILFQINYTSPSDYPILWKWEKGASARANEYANELKIKGVNGSEALAPNTWEKMNITFTIPTNAKNGDKDEETGENYGIYVYFPNKPGGALAYVKNNTFHFKDFQIKED